MKEAEHSYKGPTTSREIPDGVARYLDGTELLTKTQAMRLSTVDADGWPHAALLSAGDMVIMPSGKIRFVLFPKSTLTSNLDREGRLTIDPFFSTVAFANCAPFAPTCAATPDVPLAFFEAEVETVRHHVAPYAAVTGVFTFRCMSLSQFFHAGKQITALRAA